MVSSPRLPQPLARGAAGLGRGQGVGILVAGDAVLRVQGAGQRGLLRGGCKGEQHESSPIVTSIKCTSTTSTFLKYCVY